MPRSSSLRARLLRVARRRVLVAASLTVVLLGPAASAVAATPPVPSQATPVSQPPAALAATPAPEPPLADDSPRLVLVGVTGIDWEDVHTLSTPGLWALSREGSLGTVAARSVRSTSCPADGWLAISSGNRAADATVPDGTCRTLRETADGPVPGWQEYLTAVAAQPFGAVPGLLGTTLAAAGTTVTGIGPGAAIALADADGLSVGTHVARPTTASALRRVVQAAITTSQLVVVDAGGVRDPGKSTRNRAATGPTPTPTVGAPSPDTGQDQLPDPFGDAGGGDGPHGVDAVVEPTRAEQVRVVDERIEAVLKATRGSGATVLVVSVADSGRATLQLAAATGPATGGGEFAGNLLASGSTRQVGLVQTTDVTTTVLEALGIDDTHDAFAGAPIVPADGPGTAAARLGLVQDIGTHAHAVLAVSGQYLTRLVLTQAVLFIVAAVLLLAGRSQASAPYRRSLRGLEIAALALGSAPIASFLAGALPWWRASSPGLAFWGSVLGWTAGITALALGGPWRRALLGPAGVVAAVTVVVLALDAFTGSTLVVDSPMGAQRVMAARFYGFSNQAFAIFLAAGLVLATAVAQPLLEAGRRRLATVVVVAIGLFLIAVDGAPGLGSDFGGPPGILLAFTALALVVSGRRPKVRTLLLVVGVAVLLGAGFAVVDWLRPPADRTHLGRFLATALNGGLWDVVSRKVAVNLRVLTSWRYLVLAIGGALLTGFVLLGPHPRAGALLGDRSPMARLSESVPLLPAAVAAIGLGLGLGFLINDSGIIVPATGIAVAVPCLVAAAAQARLRPEPVAPAG
ncbi:MAG TPA: hypothetical protein VGK35_08910 [Actinotalea sp.]